jgi:hypothetical protein
MAGEFLLKNLVLFAATFAVIVADHAKAREHKGATGVSKDSSRVSQYDATGTVAVGSDAK